MMVTLLNKLGLWYKKKDTSSSYYCTLTDWNDVNQVFVLAGAIYLGIGAVIACILIYMDKNATVMSRIMTFIFFSGMWFPAVAGLIGIRLYAKMSDSIADRSIG